MILYKEVDRFDQKTGKKKKSVLEPAGMICDLTGKEVEYSADLGALYTIDYNGIDPMVCSYLGEFEFKKKYKTEIYEFMMNPYVFDDVNNEVLEEIIKIVKAAKKKGEEVPDMQFDQLIRWCRIRTADRLLTEKKYTPEQLGLEIYA